MGPRGTPCPYFAKKGSDVNLATVIVLLVIAACVALAVRAMLRDKKDGHCAGCTDTSCGGSSDGTPCPSVARAMADIDARLGRLDEELPKEQ